ncbi:MAG: TlpA family protein disulfide reductase [Alphaproteobacteria bacterium]|jgi:thiol-disulfide isomerase/thioredoxin|nr:TlpA family protein disulfide reductase [Alphaproteobacteria bacterium]
MKGFLFIAFGAFALGSGISGAVWAESGPPIEGQVQNFEVFPEPLKTADVPVLTKTGGTTTLDQFKGKFVVLNFWATWCGPCIRELPSLERLDAALPDGKAQVVLISQDRGGFKQTERFLKKLNVNFPDNFVDERLKFSRAIGVVSLPTTVLIAPDGKEIGRLVGTAEWDSPEALALVNWYLYRDKSAMEKSGR